MTDRTPATALSRPTPVAPIAVAALFLIVLLTVPLLGAAQGTSPGDEPGDPVNIFGDVEDEAGEPAPAGTTIIAVVDGTVEDTITVEEPGEFGGPNAFDERLVVNDGAGEEVVFAFENADGQTATTTLELDTADTVEEITVTFPAGTFDPEPDPDPDPDPTPSPDPTPRIPPTTGDPGPPENVDVIVERQAALDVEADQSRATFDEGTVRSVQFSIAVSGSVTTREVTEDPDRLPPGDSVSTTQIAVPRAAEDIPATLQKSVTAAQLGDRNAESLRILRLVDDEWDVLETEVVEAAEDEVIIEAETPGFSVFAVSAIEAPTAAFDVTPAEPTVGDEVTLDASASTPGNVTYEWTVDGQQFTGETVTITADDPGELTIELTVENEAGETDTAVQTIEVAPDIDTDVTLTVPDDPVTAEEPFDIEALVENTGGSPVSETLTVVLDGPEEETTVLTQAVELEPGESEQITESVTAPAVTEETDVELVATFDDATDTATVTVVPPDALIPGFGPVGAVLAVVTTALLARRFADD